MGTASRILSVISRIMALISSVIVCGIAGRFVRNLDVLGINYGSKIVYVLTLSGLSIFFALILMPPLRYQFWAFPLDLAFFVMWMVAFGLLANLSPQCGNRWYWWVWRFSWSANRCHMWRSLLAFSFISSMMWLVNCCLGFYRTMSDRDATTARGRKHQSLGSTAGDAPMVENRGAAVPGTVGANPAPVTTAV